MKIRIKNKIRFSFCCIIFLLILLNLFFAISKRLIGDKPLAKVNNPAGSFVAFAADNAGSIEFSESKYFRRYVIDCENEASEVSWEESEGYIDITLRKNNIEKLNVRTEKALEIKDIFYEDSTDNYIIRIKKKFNENNLIYIDRNDHKKIIVLIAKVDAPFQNTVVLDAGHGGYDKGANYGGLYEKDLTLKIANYAEEELKFNGFKVVRTRDKDELIDLKEISNIANSASADIFISVHINDNKDSKYKGVTTYYYDPNGLQKNERIQLASTMQKALIKSDDWEDRGIARDNLSVLRNTRIPCVLLELGFMSNLEDRDKLTKEEVLKNFGLNTVRGIMNYLSVE